MSASYSRTGGNIPAVFKTMALSAEFAASYRQKTKRPTEYIGSVIRGLELRPSRPISGGDATKANFMASSPLNAVFRWSVQDGHSPYSWPFPDGYPDQAAPWITMAAQVGRWNRASELAGGEGASSLTVPNFTKLIGEKVKTSAQILDAISKLFLGSVLPSDERAAVIKAMDQIVGVDVFQRKAASAAALVFSKPEWNLR
jgi:hypothetical protein